LRISRQEKQFNLQKIKKMEKQLQETREQQKASWNKYSSGWKKWDDLTMDFLKPFGNEIIKLLDLKDSDVVLDVAAGTGEPGLTIASKVKNGKVIITDLADDMLVIAHENATRAGIKNVEFSVCDVCELPFADNTFDAISCRMGFMFFPDMLLAAKEMVRVLKPGGKIAASVWSGPEKNFWFAGVMSVIKKHVDMPVPPAGSPGMFRCAQDGLIADLFKQAGLKNISQTELPGKLKCETAETYWSFASEVVGPVVSALSQADNALKEKIKTEVYQLVNQKYPDGKVWIDSSAMVIGGTK
jgi:ubiquinone/menaquinone biosynthesis C-methylase UbiE